MLLFIKDVFFLCTSVLDSNLIYCLELSITKKLKELYIHHNREINRLQLYIYY